MLNQVLGVQRDIFVKFQHAIQRLNPPNSTSLATSSDNIDEIQAKAMIQELAFSATQALLDLVKRSNASVPYTVAAEEQF